MQLTDTLRAVVARHPRLKKLLKPAWHALHSPVPDYVLRPTPDLLRELLGTTAPVILEIGANDGTDTLWLCETFPACRMYCFEPDARPAARFRDKLAGRSNVQLFTVALADSNGEVSFYPSTGTRSAQSAHKMPAGWDMSGSIREPTGHLAQHPWVQFKDPVTVQAQRLDDWAVRHGVDRVDFVWMDAQGAEGDIIAGGRRVFANTRFVFTEYSEREMYAGQALLPDLLRMLDGYELLARYTNDVLLRNARFPLAPGKRLKRMTRELQRYGRRAQGGVAGDAAS